MTKAKGASSRDARVLGLLLLTIVGVAKGREIASNSSTIDHDDSSRSTTISDDKAEARWTDDDSLMKSTRSVGWKSGKDSYLEALRHSRTSADPREGVVAVDGIATGSIQRRKEHVQGPVYTAKRSETSPRIVQHGSIDRDSFSMVPSDSYSLPTRSSADFSGLRNSYGPPQTSQPPRLSYGAPFNDYASATDHSADAYLPPQQAYGPPASTYGAPLPYGYGTPHGMSEMTHYGVPSIDFSWPFALKLNAFTLAKILLKLVIFKMIVKFIAIICLLLFIPKLEIKKSNKVTMGDEDEDEGRGLIDGSPRIWDRLNLLTLVVNDALDRYRDSNESRSYSSECSTLLCRARRALNQDNGWLDYEQLLRSYMLEETRLLSANS